MQIGYIIVIVCLLAYIGYKEHIIYKERQKLMDRIQARDYVEFKQHEEPVVQKEENKEEGRYIEL